MSYWISGKQTSYITQRKQKWWTKMKLVKQRKVIKWRSRMLVAWVAIRWERSGCRPLVLTLANQPACGVKKNHSYSEYINVIANFCHTFTKIDNSFFFSITEHPRGFRWFCKDEKVGGLLVYFNLLSCKLTKSFLLYANICIFWTFKLTTFLPK